MAMLMHCTSLQFATAKMTAARHLRPSAGPNLPTLTINRSTNLNKVCCPHSHHACEPLDCTYATAPSSTLPFLYILVDYYPQLAPL